MSPFIVLLGVTAAVFQQEPPAPTPEEKHHSEELVLMQLANPLSALVSVPIFLDFGYHIGPGEDGHRTALTVQPTIPLHLGQDWNVVSRSVLPFIYQEEVSPGAGTQTGIGDLTEAVYLAKVEPGPRGWVFGGGAIVQVPIGSEELLTNKKWSLGPTAAMVKQMGIFTYGLIGSQLWSIGGSGQRPDVNKCVIDPFVTYRSEGLWNLSLHVPFSYDFNADEWTVPFSLTVEKLVSYQRTPITISFGILYWAEAPQNSPHDFGFRFGLTVVLPN